MNVEGGGRERGSGIVRSVRPEEQQKARRRKGLSLMFIDLFVDS
jgi:hypothetical protein